MTEFINSIPVESNGGIPVNIQDQHTGILDWYLRQILNFCTFAADAVIDTNICTLAAGHNVVVGNVMVFEEGVNFMQTVVLAVDTNDITIDSPFDYVFTTAANVQRCNINMAVDGSVTPVIFKTTATYLNIDLDVTGMTFYIADNVAMDTGKFGGITALTRGVVLRSKDGINKNIFNVKTNGEFSMHCDEISYSDKAPSGLYEFRAVRRFAGAGGDGVTVRMSHSTNDELQVIIQDNLTALTSFHVVARGHVVTD